MLRRLLVRLFRRIVGTLMHPTSLIPKPTKMRFLHWMANKRLLVSLYYMWTGEFANEQRAVFCGQLAQWDSELDSTRYELTRSIHRIEKGLITQPRKPVFAENYIARAVQDYARLREVGHIQDHATWARDVLNVYFDAVTDTPKIKRARAEFVAIEGCENSQLAKGNDERSRVPAPRQVQHPSVAIEDLDKLAKSRHSIRKFLPKSVPREALDRAVEVARQGYIAGATFLPHGQINEDTLSIYPAETVFVVYCAGPHCNATEKAAIRLARLGRPVKKMIGGVTGWLDEGFELISDQ